MKLKSDVKFKGKLTYGLENDMRNRENVTSALEKYQNWDFDGILLTKVENI